MSPDPNTKLIICPNCGAQFNVHEPRCPYCDHLNPAGAEEKYMHDLEETRLALDQVDELAGEENAAYYEKLMAQAFERMGSLQYMAEAIASAWD